MITTSIPLAMAPENVTISWMMMMTLTMRTTVMTAKTSLPVPSLRRLRGNDLRKDERKEM